MQQLLQQLLRLLVLLQQTASAQACSALQLAKRWLLLP
jgi:hypothetical protein